MVVLMKLKVASFSCTSDVFKPKATTLDSIFNISVSTLYLKYILGIPILNDRNNSLKIHNQFRFIKIDMSEIHIRI